MPGFTHWHTRSTAMQIRSWLMTFNSDLALKATKVPITSSWSTTLGCFLDCRRCDTHRDRIVLPSRPTVAIHLYLDSRGYNTVVSVLWKRWSKEALESLHQLNEKYESAASFSWNYHSFLFMPASTQPCYCNNHWPTLYAATVNVSHCQT